MANDHQALKELAAPGAMEVIAWARKVHENTMQLMTDASLVGELRNLAAMLFTLDEREEARKLLIEYGAGKPTRIVEHRGSNKHPIAFKTQIVGAQPALTEGEPAYIPAEVVNDGNG